MSAAELTAIVRRSGESEGLELAGVSVSYGDRVALDDCSLRCARGG